MSGQCFEYYPTQSRLSRRDLIEVDNIPDIPTSHERPNLTEGRLWGWSSRQKVAQVPKCRLIFSRRVYVSCMPRLGQVSCRTDSVIGFFWVSRLKSSQVQRMSAEILASWGNHIAQKVLIVFRFVTIFTTEVQPSKSSQSSIGPWYTNPSPMVMMVCQCFHPSFMSAHTRSEYKVAHSNVGGLLQKHGRKPSAVACRFSLRSSTGFDLHIVWKCNRCIRCIQAT